MIIGSVQGIEAIPFGFHLGGFRDGEAYFSEDRNDPSLGLGQGMQASFEIGNGWKRGINPRTEGPQVFLFLKESEALQKESLHSLLGLVEGFSEVGPFLLWNGGDPFGEMSQTSIRPKKLGLELLPLRLAGYLLQPGFRVGYDCLEILILHAQRKRKQALGFEGSLCFGDQFLESVGLVDG